MQSFLLFCLLLLGLICIGPILMSVFLTSIYIFFAIFIVTVAYIILNIGYGIWFCFDWIKRKLRRKK